MSEFIGQDYPEDVLAVEQEVLAYFYGGVENNYYGKPENEGKRKELTDEPGLFTNNWCLRFLEGYEQPPTDPNAPNYALHTVMHEFAQAYPDSWNDTKQAVEESKTASDAYIAALYAGQREEAEKLRTTSRELSLRKALLTSTAFVIVAPRLQEAGIDPVKICI